jgi:hypothetical protein
MLSPSNTQVKNSLTSIKTVMSLPNLGERAGDFMLNNLNAIPLLALSLGFTDHLTTSITIFLGLSFSDTTDTFVQQMTEQTTFEVFQYGLLKHARKLAGTTSQHATLSKLNGLVSVD